MHVHGTAAPPEVKDAPRVLLVGNPNVGKSVFFHVLTGRYVVVSNYPGTTVEVSRGRGRVGGRAVQVIDTPGANSLTPNSEDERVARDVILEPGEKVVVQVADAKNLRRALLLTAQLAELEVPMVLALNMWDECQDQGLHIDLKVLEEAVGVPVVPTVATERRGFNRLVGYLNQPRPACFRPNYGPAIEEAVREIEALLPADRGGRRGLALMLLSGAPLLEAALAREAGAGFPEAVAAVRRRAAERFAGGVGMAIQRCRAALADQLVERAVTRSTAAARSRGVWRALFFALLMPAFFYAVGWRLASFVFASGGGGGPTFPVLGAVGTAVAVHGLGALAALLYMVSAWRREWRRGGSAASALGRLTCHPVGGFPVLLFALWVLYRVVGVFGAGDAVDFLENTVFGTVEEAAEAVEGAPAPLVGGVADALRYPPAYGGLVNGTLSRALGRLIGPRHIVYAFFFGETSGLISKGLTYSVAIVLPIVVLFFLLFALMEDTGYLPRLALLLDRVFKRVGLSGKAVLPMVLGLGCGTMATLTTRILETRRQRLIAIALLALAVPCSAQLGIITAMLSQISPVGVLIYVLVIVGMFFAVGWGASKVLAGEAATLILEVPPFRRPLVTNVLIKTYHRAKWFLREAVPLFLLGTACLFVAERTGLLNLIERGAKPVVKGVLGLPVEAALGFIMGFLRRDYGAVIIFDLFRGGKAGADQALIALVVITLFVPCLAHFFVCVKELGLRRAGAMAAGIFTLAILVGGLLRLFLAATGTHITARV